MIKVLSRDTVNKHGKNTSSILDQEVDYVSDELKGLDLMDVELDFLVKASEEPMEQDAYNVVMLPTKFKT